MKNLIRKFKSLIALAGAVCACVVLTCCGKKTAEKQPSDAKPQSAPACSNKCPNCQQPAPAPKTPAPPAPPAEKPATF